MILVILDKQNMLWAGHCTGQHTQSKSVKINAMKDEKVGMILENIGFQKVINEWFYQKVSH